VRDSARRGASRNSCTAREKAGAALDASSQKPSRPAIKPTRASSSAHCRCGSSRHERCTKIFTVPGRVREPHQRSAAGSLCRSTLGRNVPRQSTTPVARLGRLRTHACVAPYRAEEHGARPRLCQHNPAEATEDRCGRHRECTARQTRHQRGLPPSARVHRRLPRLERRGALSRTHEPEHRNPQSPNHPRARWRIGISRKCSPPPRKSISGYRRARSAAPHPAIANPWRASIRVRNGG
jgi:hypothetical protein